MFRNTAAVKESDCRKNTFQPGATARVETKSTFFMSPISLGLVAALLLLTAGCGSNPVAGPAPAKKGALTEEQVKQQEDKRRAAAAKLDPAYVGASNSFGLELYRIMGQRDDADNLLLSPWSISEALGMAWQGSRGTTADEIAGAAGWKGISQAEGAKTAGGWRSFLELPSDGAELNIANSVWFREGLQPLPSYRKLLEENYDGEVKQVDFAGNGRDPRNGA
ncbi:serpin family protein [Paenibacillus herberti]|uniref:Serpin domain-containing protein n=1 Tax=Paenibacillus herberti TaxID=1619309 RepID=A0A229NTZ5_9BACL|nr:serpin family protein [Paenibacillus herberti]OXM13346.1 hypothetical protein CGZ75_19965 [Paenibacillus herberti]